MAIAFPTLKDSLKKSAPDKADIIIEDEVISTVICIGPFDNAVSFEKLESEVTNPNTSPMTRVNQENLPTIIASAAKSKMQTVYIAALKKNLSSRVFSVRFPSVLKSEFCNTIESIDIATNKYSIFISLEITLPFKLILTHGSIRVNSQIVSSVLFLYFFYFLVVLHRIICYNQVTTEKGG